MLSGAFASRLPAALRRSWVRLVRALSRRRAELVYAPEYSVVVGNTPIDPERGQRVLTYLFSEGLVARRALHRPPQASLRELRWVHSDRYLESLRRPEALVPIVGYEPDDELADRILRAQRFAVGGTVMASRRALAGAGPAVNLGGGLHHAEPDRGMGFCVFNDVALAVADARRRGFDGRVLVVDLDLHDGNGTRRAFAADRRVFTFSIHNRTWDERPAVASRTIELGGEVDDERYLEALEAELPPVARRFEPDWVIYLAGTDPAFDDRLGDWRISPAAMLRRDRRVLEICRRPGGDPPLVVLLAGGYGGEAWRYSARFLAWMLTGRDDLEPPSSEEMTMRKMRRMFDFPQAWEPPGGAVDDWQITEEDVYGSLGGAFRPTRLLDHFSRHGLELVLERGGLLDRLRDLGFPHPIVEIDLGHPAGQTLRVHGDAERRELLVEVRVQRDRRALSGFDLLRLEWLLLQNPRASFATVASPLPGQNHPGLGLLAEMMALLVLLAEQVKMDGILFVPSHYHLAAKGKKYLRFVDPGDEGWFRAVQAAVGSLPLAAATAAVEGGGVRDPGGRPVAWRPMPMVLPLSGELRRRMAGADYEERVAEARRELAFRLAAG